MPVIRAVGSDGGSARAQLLLVDNYDSFTYNLAHLFCEAGADVDVRRHDAVSEEEAERPRPDPPGDLARARDDRTRPASRAR